MMAEQASFDSGQRVRIEVHAPHHPVLAALLQFVTLGLDQPQQQHFALRALKFLGRDGDEASTVCLSKSRQYSFEVLFKYLILLLFRTA
jgi:hypothetical protein